MKMAKENNNKVKFYSLYNYFDVWGNVEDGWEVNNQCVEFDDLYLADDVSEDEVIDYLIQIDFLVPNAKELVEIDNSYMDGYEIIEKETGKPICGLRPNCY